MNKYEANIMVNTFVMKVLYCIIVVVNLALPFYKNWEWHFSILQLVAVIIWFFGLLGGLGYFNQATPILQIGILRIFQLGAYFLFKRAIINWVIIIVFLALDVFFLLFLLFDKSNYYYEIVEVEEDADK